MKSSLYSLYYSQGKTLTGQTGATIPEVLNIAATGYGLKFFLAAAMTPFLYLLKVLDLQLHYPTS
jgi:hypothetical protein